MNIYLDIETVCTPDEGVLAEIAAGITPPGNYKKPETIAAWEANEKPALVAEAIARAGLDPCYGRIIVVGYAIDEEEPCAVVAHGEVSEGQALAAFFGLLSSLSTPNNRVRLVGHNIAGFDLPYLYRRAVVTGDPPPFWFPVNPKPWDDRLADTMRMWAGDRGTISLDRLCRVLGIASPKANGIDGSKIGELYAAGRVREIVDYCMDDVAAVRECYHRMTFNRERHA